MTWVRGKRKNSELFMALLAKLLRSHPDARRVHLVLDNDGIHFSKKTRLFLETRGRRIRLHPLPPYCLNDNVIERQVWRETHRNVTLNHDCDSIGELMHRVDLYLRRRNRAAARAESRKAI